MLKGLNENWRHLIKAVLLILIVASTFWVNGVVKDNDFVLELVRRFGYAGIFLIAVVSGFNFVVPVPAISFIPIFLASGLSAVITVAVAAMGMTLADFLGYLLGKTSRHIALYSLEQKVADRFKRLEEKLHWSPALVLFLFASFIPLPNEIMVMPMAFLGYRFAYILLPVFFGNVVFNAVYTAGLVNILNS